MTIRPLQSLQEHAISIKEKLDADYPSEFFLVDERVATLKRQSSRRPFYRFFQFFCVLSIILQLAVSWFLIPGIINILAALTAGFALTMIRINGLARKPSRQIVARAFASDLIVMQASVIMHQYFGDISSGKFHALTEREDIESIVTLCNTVNSYRCQNYGGVVVKRSIIPVVDYSGRQYEFMPNDIKLLIKAIDTMPYAIDVFTTIIDLINISLEEEEGETVKVWVWTPGRMKFVRGWKK